MLCYRDGLMRFGDAPINRGYVRWITANGAHIPLSKKTGKPIRWLLERKGAEEREKKEPGAEQKQKAKREQARRRDAVRAAYKQILDGATEAVIPDLRKDLTAYGGTSSVTLFSGNRRFGIKHIKSRHGEETIEPVLDVVANGKIAWFDSTKKVVALRDDKYEAILSLDRNGESLSWLLTGYLMDDGIKPRKV